MRALCWVGVGQVRCERVPDAALLAPDDAIVRVTMSSVCGSDLHLLGGYIPSMRAGDIIGHEAVGEVVAVGDEVATLSRGDRVVIAPIIGCGRCSYCEHDLWSLCDNTNPNAALLEKVWGHSIAGVLGYSHALGGFAGTHAELVRIPYADYNLIPVPDEVRDDQAVFAADALPTGYMAAEMAEPAPGDVVAVWGCGGVGQMAIQSALLLGAERVIAIDRFPDRLALAERGGAQTLDYTEVDVAAALIDMTGGRGPDACIDAVGMEAHDLGVEAAYDRVKQAVRLETDRASALRQAIYTCRKGGRVVIVGVYAGLVDKFPIGAAMNKSLTMRMGQVRPQKHVPLLLERIRRGELDPSVLATHRVGLEEGQRAYDMFRTKDDSCIRVVFTP